MPPFLLCDLETVPDATLPAFASESFPPAVYHQIACIGWGKLDIESGTFRIGASVGAEVPILERFTSSRLFATPERSHQRQAPSVCLVTFNGRRFDVPVLVARCMKHGIPWRWLWNERSARIRYSAEAHVDLADELTDFGAATPASLDVWSKLIGCEGKNGNGASVEALVTAGEWQALALYCCNDVRLTGALLLRWLRIRGRLSEAQESFLRELMMSAKAEIEERHATE